MKVGGNRYGTGDFPKLLAAVEMCRGAATCGAPRIMAKPKLAWSECSAATSVHVHPGAESPEYLAKRDLRSRDERRR